MHTRERITQNAKTPFFDCEKELEAINRNKPSIIKVEILRISTLGKQMTLRQVYNEVELENKPPYADMTVLLKTTLRRLGFNRDIDKKYFSESEISKKLNELFPHP